MSIELLLIILCSLVVLSYMFSIASRYIKIPSVLLLLFAGVVARFVTDYYNFEIPVPATITEGLGVVGLIMIVLEAGLDLKLKKDKFPLIRRSFLSALSILLITTTLISAIIHFWLNEDLTKSIIYALPLSIMSSSIVIPSIHHLSAQKKEFLIYEASFSDILGILLFNYFVAPEILTARSVGVFSGNILISIFLSIVLSVFLIFIIARTKLEVKFFLLFSLLILIYSLGKLLHLPSLLIILVFGMLVNNWENLPVTRTAKVVSLPELEKLRVFLHSITAETSFLVRTFFFILFGFSIQLSFLDDKEVILVGTLIVIALFIVRLLFLRYFVRMHVLPEVFFIPRGLITIVLFYKIPQHLKLTTFNDGILFFVILLTGFILSIGMIFYKKKNDEVLEDPQFQERKDIL